MSIKIQRSTNLREIDLFGADDAVKKLVRVTARSGDVGTYSAAGGAHLITQGEEGNTPTVQHVKMLVIVLCLFRVQTVASEVTAFSSPAKIERNGMW